MNKPAKPRVIIKGYEVQNLQKVAAEGYQSGYSFTFEARPVDSSKPFCKYGPFVTATDSFTPHAMGGAIHIGWWALNEASST